MMKKVIYLAWYQALSFFVKHADSCATFITLALYIILCLMRYSRLCAKELRLSAISSGFFRAKNYVTHA